MTRTVKDTVKEIAHFRRGKIYILQGRKRTGLSTFLSQSCRAITHIRLKEIGLTAHTHTHAVDCKCSEMRSLHDDMV